jgi:hypothetical protein
LLLSVVRSKSLLFWTCTSPRAPGKRGACSQNLVLSSAVGKSNRCDLLCVAVPRPPLDGGVTGRARRPPLPALRLPTVSRHPTSSSTVSARVSHLDACSDRALWPWPVRVRVGRERNDLSISNVKTRFSTDLLRFSTDFQKKKLSKF